ncbi:Trihelix transcription factor [Melia azedarach]|uniref:Trihelix transcription factor n=1 Tax=Melia azedarach TaxID=155640 RepID=A0ACC1YY81_MELAZ|nr:Trihelix transcription factor [Melia azedarach]
MIQIQRRSQEDENGNPRPTELRMKKTQPNPWTHEETVNLIQAYQDRWYSLKRGNLKASQWEEVAVIVALRCSYDDHSNPSAKSGSQCRHKIKKLRKRYRSEKERGATSVSAAAWPYFDLMDCLERGPLPISALPLTDYHYHEQEEEEEEEEEEVVGVRLAAEMRKFAERLERIEKRKIEMIRESGRWRMEMESKRIQMIVDSQRKIVDIISTIFAGKQ